MAKDVSKDLDLDDGFEEEDTDTDPDKDTSAQFTGGPQSQFSKIGAEDFEEETEAKVAKQREAEERDRQERLAREDKDEDGKPRLKYRSHEEAERAMKEAEKRMHTATTKAAKIELLNKDLQKRLDDATKASPMVQTPEGNPFEGKRQAIADNTITKVAVVKMPSAPVDRDDPQFDVKWGDYKKAMDKYNADVARIWADAQKEISDLAYEERQQAERERATVVEAVEKALEEAELITVNTDPEEKKDMMSLFWVNAVNVPKNIPLQDQLNRTVEICKTIVERFRGHERKRAKENKATRDSLDVLGHGTKVTPQKEPEGPSTMWEATKLAKEKRRLRFNP